MARITKSVAERRQEIIDTARILFSENGFDKTQITDIAKRMNVSQGLVYHYFKSKTEMLYAVIDQVAEQKQLKIDNALNSAEMTARQKLSILLDIKLESDGFTELMPIITSDAGINEYFSKKISSAALPMLQSLIKQGNSDGSWNCNYPDETAMFILRGVSGFFDNSKPLEVDPRKKETLVKILSLALNSLLTKEEDL